MSKHKAKMPAGNSEKSVAKFRDTNDIEEILEKGITVNLHYDKQLQKITGKEQETVKTSCGCPFDILLSIVFTSYPEIKKRYPPGFLGFTLNGAVPTAGSTLSEGDAVCFSVGYEKQA